MLKFFTYDKSSLSYKRFKFLKIRIILSILLVQIIISIGIFFLITNLYVTPEERKLKSDVSYLLTEFDNVNQRIIESELIIQQIKDHDSIIYKSLFEISDDPSKQFETYYESEITNDYKELVDSMNQRISRLQQQSAKILYSLNGLVETAESHQEMLLHIPAIQPIYNKDLKRTASGWGYRIHPIYRTRKFHYGLDFTAPKGTPIYATGSGVVEVAIPAQDKASQGYGNVMIIDHGYGYKTLYAHMVSFNAKKGQKVERGQTIGFVGSTGLSTGPHLHYEVIQNGKKVNPIYYLFHSLTPDEYQKIIKISNSIKKSYD